MTLPYAIFVVLTLLLTGALAVLTVRTAQLLRVWRPAGNPLLEPAEVVVRILLCVLCLGLGWLSGVPVAALGWQSPATGRDLVLGCAVGLALAALFYAGTRMIRRRTGDRYYSSLVADLIRPRSKRELALVAAAMIPSVLLEELLFRSLWIGGFGAALPVALLVLASALVFGIMHSPQGVVGVAGAALAGVIFGVLFLWAGSLLLPLVAHYVTNLVQIAAVRSPGEEAVTANSA